MYKSHCLPTYTGYRFLECYDDTYYIGFDTIHNLSIKDKEFCVNECKYIIDQLIGNKAPKGQYNSFGKYKYRSCKDILESLKPVLDKFKLTLFIKDDIITVNNRNYVKTTIVLVNVEKPDEITETSALAREEEKIEDMNISELLVKITEENQLRKVLLILKENKDLEEAIKKIEALLNKQ